MRVIAGSARSLPLEAPPNLDVRPTTDRYKETVFNILTPYIYNASFLDIFSGSGGIGIEALSRGAKTAVMIEQSSEAHAYLIKNLNFTKLFEKARVMKYDYTKALVELAREGKSFDLIYMDPPFNQNFEAPTVEMILEGGLLSEDGMLVMESDKQTDLSFLEHISQLEIIKEKIFKTCRFTFIKRK